MPQMRSKNRVLSDKNLFGMAALLAAHDYQVRWFEGEKGLDFSQSPPFEEDLSKENQLQIDAAVIRTVTKINQHTLNYIPYVQAIVSASAGTDHVDTNLLNRKGIYFDNAAGSNARAVAEYVLTAIVKLVCLKNIPLANLSVGIIGVGAVGSEADKLLGAAGVTTILYDPPRAKRDSTFTSAEISELKKADILSFHTPLITDGPDKTYHLFDEVGFWSDVDLKFLAVINAARGGVLNELKLLTLKKDKVIEFLICDVWENEPLYNEPFRQACLLATPHIAGYSLQAKLRASWQCVLLLNNFFGKETHKDFDFWLNELLPKQKTARSNSVYSHKDGSSLYDILCSLNPIEVYHQKLVALDGFTSKEKSRKFKELRIQESLRDEYAYIKIEESLLAQFPLMRVLQTR